MVNCFPQFIQTLFTLTFLQMNQELEFTRNRTFLENLESCFQVKVVFLLLFFFIKTITAEAGAEFCHVKFI